MLLARCAAVGSLTLACAWISAPVHATEAPRRPRIIVSSDLPPLDVIPGKGARAGDPPEKLSDPDDIQSMVRFLLYANEMDVEGLVASAGTFANVARKQHILDLLDVYGRVVGSLQRHDPRYPGAERLRAVTWQGRDGAWGTPDFGAKTPTLESILGAGKDSEASDAIIRVVDRPDPRPVWFCAWGGSREVAQAIWTVRATRSPEELARFVGKLRLYLIGRQDRTTQWLLDSFPDLFVILTRKNYQGMFWNSPGSDPKLADAGLGRRERSPGSRSARRGVSAQWLGSAGPGGTGRGFALVPAPRERSARAERSREARSRRVGRPVRPAGSSAQPLVRRSGGPAVRLALAHRLPAGVRHPPGLVTFADDRASSIGGAVGHRG